MSDFDCLLRLAAAQARREARALATLLCPLHHCPATAAKQRQMHGNAGRKDPARTGLATAH